MLDARKRWRGTTRWRTSSTRCRVSAPGRSRCSARRSRRPRFLPPVRSGDALAAFALSEPDAGSDVAAMATTATAVPGGWRLDGTKTWISNGGIAAHYVVFARTDEAPGTRGISAFVVPADTPGLSVTERIEVIAPHPLATLRFDACVVGPDSLLGRSGEGFKVAMATLDIFRPTVGAAALGMARRALDEAVHRAKTRRIGQGTLGRPTGHAIDARGHGDRGRRGGAACLPRRVDPRHRRGPHHAGGGDGQDVRDRGGAARDRCRRADLRRAGRSSAAASSNPSIATCAPCASTKEPPKCRR